MVVIWIRFLSYCAISVLLKETKDVRSDNSQQPCCSITTASELPSASADAAGDRDSSVCSVRRGLMAAACVAFVHRIASPRLAGAAEQAPTAVVIDKTFNVKGDGQSNDRANLQRAIDQSVGKTLLLTGASRIDASGLQLRNGSHLRFEPGASLTLLPHNQAAYQMLRIWDVRDVVVEGAVLNGSKELNGARNDPDRDGYGMGISIAGSSNVTLISPTTIGCWGDGIYIANSYERKGQVSSHITVRDHLASDCRRQGVSLISGSNILFERPVWQKIGGTMPSAGLDIEPNSNLDLLDNIRIVDPVTRRCRTGILMYLQALPGVRPKTVSIEITGHRDELSAVAPLNISGLELEGNVVTGTIRVNSSTWVSSRVPRMRSENYDAARGPKIIMEGLKIIS
ncbi:right-handed parallel beta-helix repeat-containing protein [Paraburkholderia sp. LEh10]|uniref:right-handed parallel beta-helix repeat-containing protein n=1 Tax=Paraburkholderia sp. LEh10 TaxID=2821353 RepID=UPI001FD77318|nr:right-handed parallel beta-helix repeat-containing protein [Paraburkholderia sp. LEh10]